MQPSSKAALEAHLRAQSFRTVLDAPSGNGWLRAALTEGAALDGIDLFAQSPPGYRRFWQHDLDDGLPEACTTYDLICCCEGIEHVGNPLRLLRAFRDHLAPTGQLIVTTPNVWFPQARLQYWWRGFFPSFPALAGKVVPGTHMHITPWCYPQLYVFFRLAGFDPPRILIEPLSRPKHWHERLLALPARQYCQRRRVRAATTEERQFWLVAGSDASLLGRHLMVTAGLARVPETAAAQPPAV
ncbi:MAG: class I SAM-dependent methyltransferase [Verrucomicrobia bacterium]|nr:class I SAM-dependent methyltransferase [Verrucomicrobiota bacterium]